jgi:hypothetical protein
MPTTGNPEHKARITWYIFEEEVVKLRPRFMLMEDQCMLVL